MSSAEGSASGSLRFKNSSQPAKHRKKRRKVSAWAEEGEESIPAGRITPPPDILNPEPITPPRNGKARKVDEYVFDFDGYDMDQLEHPPGYDSEEDRDTFKDKLFDAMREDEGVDAWEGHFTSGQHWRGKDGTGMYVDEDGISQSKNGSVSQRIVTENGVVLTQVVLNKLQGMTDQEYTDHIRTGMWRRTHKEELARQEEAKRQQAEKERKAKEDREKRAREDAEKRRLVEERARAKTESASRQTRETYAQAWEKLASSAPDAVLDENDIPWPVDRASAAVDASSIATFLLAHIPFEDARRRKQTLRTAVLAYHPDRFDRYVNKVPEAKDQRKRVRDMGLRISQVLNDLLATIH